MNIETALTDWKTHRLQLAIAIQRYLTACKNLSAAHNQPVHAPRKRLNLEVVLAEIDPELQSLVLQEESLRDARLSLTATRNSPTIPALLPTLPPEILSHIFTMVQHDSDETGQEGLPSVHLLAGISSYWRRVAIGTPSLRWTNISIRSTWRPGNNYANLSLDRSGNLPVSLSIFERSGGNVVTEYLPLDHGEPLSFLRRAISQSCMLGITAGAYSTISLALKLWLDIGTITETKTLQINRLTQEQVFNYDTPNEVRFDSALVEHSDAMLRSLTTLHLRHFVLPWTSIAYYGLNDLALYFSDDYQGIISTTQFVDILKASPDLRVLKLRGLTVVSSNDGIVPTSVPLSHLEVLHLSDMDWELTLPLISLTDCQHLSSVVFHFFSRPPLRAAYSTFESLLRKVQLDTLVIAEGSSPCVSLQWALSLSKMVCALQTLVLSRFNIPRRQLSDLVTTLKDGDTIRSTVLPYLYITSATAHTSDLMLIVTTNGVQNLYLEDCTVTKTIRSKGPKIMGELQNSLLKVLPKLNCVVSDIDTTTTWPCRKMFNQYVCYSG